jgi:hypothetical protein
VKKTKTGDRLIKPGSQEVYVVTKVVINDGWVILKEEDGDRQILTSKESLETWKKKSAGVGRSRRQAKRFNA